LAQALFRPRGVDGARSPAGAAAPPRALEMGVSTLADQAGSQALRVALTRVSPDCKAEATPSLASSVPVAVAAEQAACAQQLSFAGRSLEEGGACASASALPSPPSTAEDQLRLRRLSLGLGIMTAAVLVAEVYLLQLEQVPWRFDKPFFLIAIAFQVAMAAFWPLKRCAGARCRGLLMDACHWAFAVMMFAGGALLRSHLSILFIAAMSLATVLLRIVMDNTCLITVVAERSSLPDISGNNVTIIFGTLLACCLLRVALMLPFAEHDGWPVQQIFSALGLV